MVMHSTHPLDPQSDSTWLGLGDGLRSTSTSSIFNATFSRRDGAHMLGAPIDTGTGADPAVLEALMVTSDHIQVVAAYRVIPELAVGVLHLISSLGLLRRRLLGRARHEVLNQPLPCSIPALTGPGSCVILSATGSEPVSGPLGFNGSAKRADQCSSW